MYICEPFFITNTAWSRK